MKRGRKGIKRQNSLGKGGGPDWWQMWCRNQNSNVLKSSDTLIPAVLGLNHSLRSFQTAPGCARPSLGRLALAAGARADLQPDESFPNEPEPRLTCSRQAATEHSPRAPHACADLQENSLEQQSELSLRELSQQGQYWFHLACAHLAA